MPEAAVAPFDIDAAADEYDAQREAEAAAESGAAPAAVPAEAPAAPAGEAPAAADDWVTPLLAHEGIPQNLRGKPAPEVFRTLAEERKWLNTQVNENGRRANDAETRAQVAETILKVMQRGGAEAQPQRTDMDILAEPSVQIPRMFEDQLRPLQEQLANLQRENTWTRMESARGAAMTSAGIHDPQTAQALAGPLGGYMAANGLDGTVQANWGLALDWLKSSIPLLAPKVTVAPPAAPPAGSAQSRGTLKTAQKLPPKDQREFDAIMSAMSIAPGTKLYDETLAGAVAEQKGSAA